MSRKTLLFEGNAGGECFSTSVDKNYSIKKFVVMNILTTSILNEYIS